MRRTAVSLAVLFLASACGTSTVSTTSLRTCHVNADCPAGDSCQYSVYESCGTLGVCIRAPDGSACVPQTACGCNGGTETVCLVSGNSPSPIISLGSCDGATQQGYDASIPPVMIVDAMTPPDEPDAADSSMSTMPPEDSAPPQDSAPPPVDAADSAPASTYGSPCDPNQGNADCTDPVYDQCGLNDTCTKTCTRDSQCPVPPTVGTCNELIDLCD